MPKKPSNSENIEDIICEIEDFPYILNALFNSKSDEIQDDYVPKIFCSKGRYLYKFGGSLSDIHSELLGKD